VAIAGVMGGQESEVRDDTRTILLESATFEGINNRRTGQALKLFSAASYRFARGIPATLNDIAARRAATLMMRYAGGRLVPGMVDAYPVVQSAPTVYTSASDMRRILGMEVALEDAASALRQLDFTVATVAEPKPHAPADAIFALHREPGEPLLECTPPWHRLDIRYPADLCEEVARIIGYERVGETLMEDTLPTQRRNEIVETEETIRDILIGAGLQDTVNYALTSPEHHDKLTPGQVNPGPLHRTGEPDCRGAPGAAAHAAGQRAGEPSVQRALRRPPGHVRGGPRLPAGGGRWRAAPGRAPAGHRAQRPAHAGPPSTAPQVRAARWTSTTSRVWWNCCWAGWA
jgi:phenylalanyl-tRNA synthetase beta subunit